MFVPRSRTDLLVVHCAATPPTMDIGVSDIRAWHIARGFADIGYHYVIRRNGEMEQGRPVDVVGAHVSGSNHRSIGICLVGGTDQGGTPDFNFTRAQLDTLEVLLDTLRIDYPHADVIGHRDVPGVLKACPCFDVRSWYGVEMDRAP